MSGIFDFDDKIRPLFEVHGRPKKNKTKEIQLKSHRSRAERVVGGAPEVVVRITGHARGAKSMDRLLKYITRDGELVGEKDQDETINGKDAVSDLTSDWVATAGKRLWNTRDTYNFVLSMPADTPPQGVLGAAKAFAEKEFSANHEYIMVLHTPETDPSPEPSPNPHVHLIVKSLGFDNRRLNPRKADLQRYRESFAEKLIEQGIEAEASPRQIRGVVKKPKTQAIHHATKRDPRTQRMESAVREVAAELTGSLPPRERPWEAAIRDKQTLVRATWLEAAKSLEGSSEQSDRELSIKIRSFVTNMPKIATRRHEIEEQLRATLNERLSRDQWSNQPRDGER